MDVERVVHQVGLDILRQYKVSSERFLILFYFYALVPDFCFWQVTLLACRVNPISEYMFFFFFFWNPFQCT